MLAALMHSLLRGWGKGVLSFMWKEFRGEAGSCTACLPSQDFRPFLVIRKEPQFPCAKLLGYFSFHFAGVVFYVAWMQLLKFFWYNLINIRLVTKIGPLGGIGGPKRREAVTEFKLPRSQQDRNQCTSTLPFKCPLCVDANAMSCMHSWFVLAHSICTRKSRKGLDQMHFQGSCQVAPDLSI